MVTGKYMLRKRFFIPKKEIFRDYRDGHEKDVANFLFKCDYLEVWEDDDEISTS